VNEKNKITLQTLKTGVSGFDEILGGGLPEYSFNLIAGSPGSGKTTLAHQIMFANASPERPALYITVLGEPAIKMLRYQQLFNFFDQDKLNDSIKFVNLSEVVLEKNFEAVLEAIVREVESFNACIVIGDSFRSVVRKASRDELELQGFVQQLALHLTSYQATTFLIGEYAEAEMRDNPLFTVADGIYWLSQQVERNSVVRKFQIVKLRGQAPIPGLHTFRITQSGVEIFPRTIGLMNKPLRERTARRLTSGIKILDEMMHGGIPEGDSVLIAGPSGTGKSVLASEFIAEGVRKGEPGILAIFEEQPPDYTNRARSFGLDFVQWQQDGNLTILYLRPLDLSVDETVLAILEAVKRTGASRVVLDSLAGFELALAPAFRTDFRESLYRMIGELTRSGITVLSTVELEESFTALSFSSYSISFLCDDLIRLKYVEIDGQLRKALVIVKMRGGDHSKDIMEYQITSDGIVIGERLRGYTGLISSAVIPTQR
jgi:circadian clock protein KaiC